MAALENQSIRPQRDVNQVPRVEIGRFLCSTPACALGWPTGTASLATALLEQHQLFRLTSFAATRLCVLVRPHLMCVVLESESGK